jgi:hypothetical protein
MSRPAALGCVTRDVEEFTFFFTFRTFLWQHGCSENKSTLAALPVGLIALGTDISSEPAFCRVAAVSTFIGIFLILHSLFLLSFHSQFKNIFIKKS